MANIRAYGLCLVFLWAINAGSSDNSNRLVVVLLDGIRWDYLEPKYSGFRRIIQTGVQAERLIPTYPTNSYPNYYSIMTGLYSESHGMVHNYMYDSIHNETFWVGRNPEAWHSFWWEGGDPVWITARRQGRRSHMFFWPNCDVVIHGLTPTFCELYTGKPSRQNFTNAIDATMELLVNGTSDLMVIYFEYTDTYGHRQGRYGPELEKSLHFLSGEFDRLQDFLMNTNMGDGKTKLAESVNLIVLSDHGMSSVQTTNETTINLTGLINATADLDRISTKSGQPSMHLWPKEGKAQKVYDALKGYHPALGVYLRSEVPEEYHYRTNYRIPPIVLQATQPPWAIVKPGGTFGGVPYYDHGYPPSHPDMAGVFIATGPGFRKNYTTATFENIQIYQIMCHLIGIVPSPHNGSWDQIIRHTSDEPVSERTQPSQPTFY